MQFEVCYSMDGKVCLYRYGSCQSAKIRLKNLIELLYFLKASSSLSTLSYVQELNKARMTRRMIETCFNLFKFYVPNRQIHHQRE